MSGRSWMLVAVFGVLVALLFALRVAVGGTGFGVPGDGFVLELRVGRALTALTVGAALSVSGVLLQASLRNPLASPYLLGMSAGATLGVVVQAYVAFVVMGSLPRPGGELVPAGAGAVGAFALVWALARRRGRFDAGDLILVGVVVTLVLGALATFVQSLLTSEGLARTARWLMGSISDETRPGLIGVCAALVGAGAVWSWWSAGRLDVLTLGDDEALSLGVRAGRLRGLAVAVSAVLTACAVVLAGPIAFVGLMGPHLGRLLVGATHRALVPMSAVLGAGIVLGAEDVSALVRLESGRTPIGVLTALIGGPAFVVLLRRTRRGGA